MSPFERLHYDVHGNAPSMDRFWMGIGVITVMLLMAYGSYWLYTAESEYVQELMSADRAIVVFSEYFAGLLFGPVALVAMAAILLMHILYRDIFKRTPHKIAQKIILGLYALMFLGLALLLVGGMLVNSSWASTFKDNGYTECSNFVLRFNKNLMNEAWVKDPSFCLDEKLHQILHENHSRRGFEQAARYLERTYR